MFIVTLRGGLGNQLFQYAFGLYLNQRFNEKILYNTYYLENDSDGRSLSLNNILNTEIQTMPFILEIIVSYYYKIKSMLLLKSKDTGFFGEEKFRILSSNALYVTSDVFKYFEIVNIKKYVKYVDGFFQSARYYIPNKDIILSQIRTINLNSRNKNVYEKIKDTNSVCVHIRRGDYISEKWKKKVEICTEEYYCKAMNYVEMMTENPVFFIFSNNHDDIVWIKENYTLPFPMVYVDLNNKDYEDLQLMKCCKHFVLSNSSYSWWVQFLSDNENKIVVAPSKWHNVLDDYKEIYLKEWKIIDV